MLYRIGLVLHNSLPIASDLGNAAITSHQYTSSEVKSLWNRDLTSPLGVQS